MTLSHGACNKEKRDKDARFMRLALEQAEKAQCCNEVPVGAVLVGEDSVLGVGYNQPITQSDPTAHAEIVAIRQLAQARTNYRLPDITLYVTIEPCMMCVGAIVQARIARVVFGAFEPRAGALVSHPYNAVHDCWNHRFEVEAGVLDKSCGKIMKDFFSKKR